MLKWFYVVFAMLCGVYKRCLCSVVLCSALDPLSTPVLRFGEDSYVYRDVFGE